jgi:histidinol-phosphate aminotransferase
VPGFVMYAMSAQLQGLAFHGVPLTAGFELDEAAMREAMRAHRPSITYLAYPNNPTANRFDVDVMRRLIAEAASFGGLVVVDEAYQPFSSHTWLDEMRARPEANAHVLLMRTLSKFGLAGVRIGYLTGPAALVNEVDKLRPPYNVSALNAECALFALEHAEVFAQQASVIREQREALMAALARLPGVTPFPSEANMVLARVPDAQRAFDGLKAQGVLVKNVSKMHPLLAQCLRLTVGTPDENARLIQALQTAL